MYKAGVGVDRDLVKAYSLFTSAGKTLDASKQLTELSSKMSPDDLAKLQWHVVKLRRTSFVALGPSSFAADSVVHDSPARHHLQNEGVNGMGMEFSWVAEERLIKP
jgi:hypothetical protein